MQGSDGSDSPATAPPVSGGDVALPIRILAWISFGLFVICIACFADINRLLADVRAPGAAGYDSAVFTRPELPLGRYERLTSAAEIWKHDDTARRLITWHVGVDMVFCLAYCVLLYLLLRWLKPGGRNQKWFRPILLPGIPFLIFTADEVENYLVLDAFVRSTPDPGDPIFALIHWTSAAKWLFIAIAALAVAYLALTPSTASLRTAHRGGRQHPLLAMSTTWLTSVLLFALVALPAGGPLDQMPDVIREQLTPGTGWIHLSLSLLSVALLTGAVTISGLASTVGSRTSAPPGILSNAELAIYVGLACALLTGLTWLVEGTFRPPTVATGALFLFIVLASWVAKGLGAATTSFRKAPPREPPVDCEWTHRELLWVGAAAGLIVVSVGLGFVRATLPLVVQSQSVERWWLVIFTLGAAAALGGGLVMQQVVAQWQGIGLFRPFSNRWQSRVPFLLIAIPVAVLSAVFSVAPSIAGHWGSPGVVAVGFSSIALLLGFLKWMSNNARRWTATTVLGFSRTPWPLLVFLVWVTSSFMNKEGVYHDIRTVPRTSPDSRDGIEAAFTNWLEAQTACAPNAQIAPLIMVAAPGGGIRAAYWTATVLDELSALDSKCKRDAIFAISGVSGGSVGATTWLRAHSIGTSGSAEVRRIASDTSLSAAISGLLIRDLYQPLLGMATSWRDRAALLEDGWKKSASSRVFGDSTSDTTWSEIRSGSGWVPHLVLNSSSVTDGCRVLLSTLAGLPASKSPDCFSRSDLKAGNAAHGPATGAIDPLPQVADRLAGDRTCLEGRDIRATTAALLSARFPLVSPTGAIFQCGTQDPLIIYAVDGGYYENTGLLTVYQLWAALEPHVARHNAGSTGPLIVPWVVVLDNHYQAGDARTARARPRETTAPFRAFGNGRHMFGPGALLQSVEFEIRAHELRCKASAGGVLVIRPENEPLVAAPLGWALSGLSADILRDQARNAVAADVVDGLRSHLRRTDLATPRSPGIPLCMASESTTESATGRS